ncbi:uncharacterized protein LOC132741367 [Ruditapes philippinarum]|uniref:uncharacterized protein LOC132741367 n=1 Tax=Ruditapes philippinarum TaxID=129788 RepID=UPI00295AA44B|nr:uncharacterized protein LOC132741367 [Ruditapes philippinarum]
MANAYDFIRAAALVIGLGYSAQQDRKSWIWGDSVLWGAYALGLFFFPGMLFPGSENAMMCYITRVFASVLIGVGALWYLTRKTRDENVIGVNLWSRLISSLLLLTFLIYTYFQQDSKLTEKTMYFDMLAYGMLLMTTVYQFWRGEYRVGGREQKGNLSMLFRMMFLLMFMAGLCDMTFPSWVIPFKKLAPMESLAVRCTGALIFGCSFLALYAPSFRYDDDKSSLLLSTLVTMVFYFISLNVAYFKDDLFSHQETLIMHAGMLPLVILMLGLYILWGRDAGTQSEYNLRSKSN